MSRGVIKKIVSDRGFGFIAGESGEEYFFHHTSVADDGFEELKEGQNIEFEIEAQTSRKGKGPRAISVKPL